MNALSSLKARIIPGGFHDQPNTGFGVFFVGRIMFADLDRIFQM
jgi:hypothetical protein